MSWAAGDRPNRASRDPAGHGAISARRRAHCTCTCRSAQVAPPRSSCTTIQSVRSLPDATLRAAQPVSGSAAILMFVLEHALGGVVLDDHLLREVDAEFGPAGLDAVRRRTRTDLVFAIVGAGLVVVVVGVAGDDLLDLAFGPLCPVEQDLFDLGILVAVRARTWMRFSPTMYSSSVKTRPVPASLQEKGRLFASCSKLSSPGQAMLTIPIMPRPSRRRAANRAYLQEPCS